MIQQIENVKTEQPDAPWWMTVVKTLAGIVVIYVLARLIAIPFVYEFFVSWLSTDFGLEIVYARPFAILLTVIAAAATPTLLLAMLFGYRMNTVIVWAFAASFVVALATYLFTGDVYFDRTTGKAQKCYAKTMEGFKFSSTCDYDPKLGVRFQLITPEITKEIAFWQKNSKLENIAPVKDGQYFDPLTGEPVAWYSIHSDGSMFLFSLPGFDPATGEVLKPITRDIIEEQSPGGHRTPRVVDKQKAKALLLDINRALAEGYGQHWSTEGSRRALGNIWKWYYSQKGIPNVKSTSASAGGRAWIPNNGAREILSYPAIFQAEKVINVGTYTLLTVSFSAEDKATKFYCHVSVRDENGHDMQFEARPELVALRDTPAYTQSEEELNLNLNPHETTRVMYFIKNASPTQMNTGYVECDGGIVKYGPAS